jgi:hypothetical protein
MKHTRRFAIIEQHPQVGIQTELAQEEAVFCCFKDSAGNLVDPDGVPVVPYPQGCYVVVLNDRERDEVKQRNSREPYVTIYNKARLLGRDG